MVIFKGKDSWNHDACVSILASEQIMIIFVKMYIYTVSIHLTLGVKHTKRISLQILQRNKINCLC